MQIHINPIPSSHIVVKIIMHVKKESIFYLFNQTNEHLLFSNTLKTKSRLKA